MNIRTFKMTDSPVVSLLRVEQLRLLRVAEIRLLLLLAELLHPLPCQPDRLQLLRVALRGARLGLRLAGPADIRSRARNNPNP